MDSFDHPALTPAGPAGQPGPLELPALAAPPPAELPPVPDGADTSFSAEPPRNLLAHLEPAPLGGAMLPAPVAPAAGRGPGALALPALGVLSLLVLLLYAAPYLLYHWRWLDAKGEAEAFYARRRAELRAEAEHADERLDALDRRVHLVSLGFREVVRKVSPWVVNVTNYREPRRAEQAVGRRLLFRDPDDDRDYVQAGVGSGLLVKPGVVLTNHHVVRGAARLRVAFASGQSVAVAGDAVAVDGLTDLAVLRLPDRLAEGLRQEADAACAFADSDRDVQVGDWALAVGSPLGLRQTVTQGVISAKGRLLQLLDLVELLQTDAAINPGNSGGPLFDQHGRVAGINVAIAGDAAGGNQGIGFAIPSNTARRIAEQLLAHGEVPRGYLGIALEEVSTRAARALNVDDGAVRVKDIIPGEAGERSGLRAGDVVVRVGATSLRRVEPLRHLRQLIVDAEPGTEVTLELVRDGARRELPVKIGKRPADLP